MLAKVALGLTAPLMAAVLWGMFAAPRAPFSSPPLKLGARLAVFGSAALALVLALAVVVNGVLVRL